MNEWEFTGDAVSWINEILARNSDLPFHRAKCEQRGTGSRKRRDLTLLDKAKRPILTGEIKLPYQKDGSTPYNAAVVKDARSKALGAKARFFFTWNVNQCVLWETTPTKTTWLDRDYKSWDVISIHREDQLEFPMTARIVQTWLEDFLNDFAQIARGAQVIGHKAPDEKFIDALESALKIPVLLTLQELDAQYKKSRFKAELDKWMRNEQGWIIYDDPEGIQDNLERAAKFASYALVNKLVFHEALLKRYAARKMTKLTVPKHIDTAEALRNHLEGYFADAKKVTGDYETVFGEDHTGIGNRIPFYSDHAVPHWRTLINQIHEFDFSKLDYEIIGTMFERLVSEEERRKFGQFYTCVEVVDLINSFCIRTGEEKIMDPACGGGTFLVRAYARKRELAPNRKHGDILSDLFGVDVSDFAGHLTTINLATRDLVDEENYPQIARSNFFDIDAHKTFLTLPKHMTTRGLGATQHRRVQVPPLDAVVGNPPYIRQEHITKAKKKGKHGWPSGTKQYYQELVKTEANAIFSGRSDIHCYFWAHGASFLKDEGWLSLVTSSGWLDVEYGFRLQDWLLRKFEIVAVLESIDEPWFVGARVATTVTVLRQQRDDTKRMNNMVRFVQLRRPMREILAHDGTTAGAVRAADKFRDEILSLKANVSNERYRARLVRQGKLWAEGVRLGLTMGNSKGAGDHDPESQAGDYYGCKWGVYLRAPDLWFELVDTYANMFTPLGEIADVRRGITSGKDSFFFPIDCTGQRLSDDTHGLDFKAQFGVTRADLTSGKVRLVSCGEERGEIRPLEACYLEPEIHSLMGIHQFTVGREACSKSVFLVDRLKTGLKNTFALQYIERGESQGYHKLPTCRGRLTQDRQWYDLTRYKRPDIILPKIQQYRLIAFLNPDHLHINCSLLGLYDVKPSQVLPFCAILNSTIAILSRIMYARVLGNEGNIQLDVYLAKMMLVPNISACGTPSTIRRITQAFDKMLRRNVFSFLSERRLRAMAYTGAGKKAKLEKLPDVCELDMPDRRELDDAVLQLLGINSKKKRSEFIDRLYSYLRDFFESIRQKEEKAILNKKKAKRRGPARPGDIAAQIYQQIMEKEGHLLRQYEPDFLDTSKPFDTFDIPPEGTPTPHRDMVTKRGVMLSKGKQKNYALIQTDNAAQDDLIVLLVNSGMRGLVRIPHEEWECRRVFRDFKKFVQNRERRIHELIADRTADEDMQQKTYDALTPFPTAAVHV